MHGDVLVAIATAGTDAGQAGGADEGDLLACHAGRSRPDHQHFRMLGGPAGFFFQFADGGHFNRFVRMDIAHQPRWHLDGRRLQRYAELFDEDHLVLRRHRDDDRGQAAGMGALHVFPGTALQHAQVLAFMDDAGCNGLVVHAAMLIGTSLYL